MQEIRFSNPVQDNGAINGDYANITVNGVPLSNVPVIDSTGTSKRVFRFGFRIWKNT